MKFFKKTIYVSEACSLSDDGSYNLPAIENGILYITDSESLFNYMQTNGYPVVAHSHLGNKQSSFRHAKYIVEDIDEISTDDYELIYRRVLGIPWDILETDRLNIRETSLDDLPSLFKLYEAPLVTKYMENLFGYEEEYEYQKQYIENIYGLYDIGIWSLVRKDDNCLIGRMGIEYKDDPNSVELGFMLGEEYQHMGYATEAATAIIEFARTIDGLNSIKCIFHKENHSSRMLCQRLGFKKCNSFLGTCYGENSPKNEPMEEWIFTL